MKVQIEKYDREIRNLKEANQKTLNINYIFNIPLLQLSDLCSFSPIAREDEDLRVKDMGHKKDVILNSEE